MDEAGEELRPNAGKTGQASMLSNAQQRTEFARRRDGRQIALVESSHTGFVIIGTESYRNPRLESRFVMIG